MKKYLFGILIILLITASATAALETPSEVILDIDYGKFTSEDQDTIPVEGTLNIKNTGTLVETIKISATNLPSDYNSSETSEITIDAGATKEIKFTVNVPHEKGTDKKEIGIVKILGVNGAELSSIKLFQTSKQMIKLSELKVSYTAKDDDSESDEFSDDKEEYSLSKDVKPGTEMELKFSLENLFDDGYENDGELEDVRVEIESSDQDLFADEFEDLYEVDNIDADRKKDLVVKFMISDEADEDNFELEITIKADDGKNIDYRIKKVLKFELGRESDDVKVTKFEIIPDKITLCEDQFTFDVEIKNVGSRSQKYAGISIYNKELDINHNIQDIKLDDFSDSDNSWSQTFTHPITNTFKEGVYSLDIRTYVQKTKVMETLQKQVVILKCAKQDKPTTGNTNAIPNNNNSNDNNKVTTPLNNNGQTTGSKTGTSTTTLPTTTTNNAGTSTTKSSTGTQKISSAAIVKTVENPYSRADILVAVLLVAIALTLIIIIVFLMILLKR